MEDLSQEQIYELSDKKLENLHGRLHAYWRRACSGEGWDKDEIVKLHLRVINAFIDRDKRHKKRDKLDNFKSYSTNLDDYEELEMALTGVTGAGEEWESTQFGRPLPGIYLRQPHVKEIVEGEKTLITQPRKYTKFTGTPIYLVTNREDTEAEVYGIIVLDYPVDIGLQDFKALRSKHRISEDERKTRWPDRERFYAYRFNLQETYIEPKKAVNLPMNAVTWIGQVEIAKKLNQEFLNAVEEVEDLVVIPNFASFSGSGATSKVDREPNDTEIIWRADFEESYLKIPLTECLMKFDRAFPKNIQDEFDHVDSFVGPTWQGYGLCDLVLRFKHPPEKIEVDESYSYHKKFKIELMKPFKPIKSKAGYHKFEFEVGDEEELWETWAKGYIKEGEPNAT